MPSTDSTVRRDRIEPAAILACVDRITRETHAILATTDGTNPPLLMHQLTAALAPAISCICNLIEDAELCANIFLIDEGRLVCLVQCEKGRTTMPAKSLSISASICGAAAETGVAKVVPDISSLPEGCFDNCFASPMLSELALPMRAGTEVVGVLNLECTIASMFTENHANQLRVLADAAGAAIHLIRSHAENLRIALALSTIAHERDPQRTLELILSSALDAVGARVGQIQLLDAANRLVIHANRGLPDGASDMVLNVEERYASGRVILTGRPQYLPDTRLVEDNMAVWPVACCELLAPLVAGDAIIGVLGAQSDGTDSFAGYSTLLTRYALMMGPVVRRVQERAATEALSDVDKSWGNRIVEINTLRNVIHAMRPRFIGTFDVDVYVLQEYLHRFRVAFNATDVADSLQVPIDPPDDDMPSQELLENMADILIRIRARVAEARDTFDEVVGPVVQRYLAQTSLEERDVDTLVSAALRYAEAFRPAKITVEVNLTRGLPPVRCSPPDVIATLLNLLENAYRALDGQGTSLSIQTTAIGDLVAITVTDDGVPLPEGAAVRLFQAPASESDTLEAPRGWGLYYNRRVLEEMGGGLELLDQEGPFKRFRATLPIAADTDKTRTNERVRA